MAVLEEWLQQKYVENYEDAEKYFYYDDAGNKHESKQELLAAKVDGLFFKDGTRNFIMNDGNIYYLINKSKLPDEVRSGLVGGNTTESEYAKYTRLIDVYGVTDNLKVYYYDSERGTAYGDVESSGINLKNIIATGINSDAGTRSLITDVLDSLQIKIDETKGITAADVVAVKELNIDGNTYDLNNLNALSEIKNLKTLTLSNLTLDDLKGLEGCPNLYYLYLKNCKIKDYSNLCSVIGLTHLYIYLPSSMSETEANNEVINLGLGLKDARDLTKLNYFGISRRYFDV